MFSCTCFGQLCAYHQEKIPYLKTPENSTLHIRQPSIYIYLCRMTNTRCRIGTVFSPDDGNIVARNMYRKAINILRKFVHQFGSIYKNIYYTLWVLVSYPACYVHVPLLYYQVWPVRLCVIFSHYFINGTILGGENLLHCKMCILILSATLFETFLILQRIQRDIVIDVHRCSCKVPYSCKVPIFLDRF